jgi:MFS family permease
VFTAGFVILQPFSTAISRSIGCREWISAQLAVWGVLAMSHAAIRDRMTFFVLRFFIGVAEAGFIPSAMFFLSNLYPKEYIAFRVGLFTGLYSFSNTVSGLLADAVMRLEPGGIHNWQVLYLLEGGLTVAMALMSFWILPSSAGTAWMLSPDERAHASHRMNEDTNQPVDLIDNHKWSLQDFTDAIRDWRKMVLSICTTFVIIPLWSFFSIMPLIANSLGFKGASAGFMLVPPFLVYVGSKALLKY